MGALPAAPGNPLEAPEPDPSLLETANAVQGAVADRQVDLGATRQAVAVRAPKRPRITRALRISGHPPVLEMHSRPDLAADLKSANQRRSRVADVESTPWRLLQIYDGKMLGSQINVYLSGPAMHSAWVK